MPEQTKLPEVVEQAERSIAKASPPEEMTRVLEAALHSPEVTPEKLLVVADLHDRLMAQQAARDFNRALAEFRAECPAIRKTKSYSIASSGGAGGRIHYADLEDIREAIEPVLAKHGLSYSWTACEGEMRCVLRHEGGHSEASAFPYQVEDKGRMNVHQRTAAGTTYAKRYALLNVLGLVAEDDTDGRDGSEATAQKITEDQYANLKALCEETGTVEGKVATVYGVSVLAELPAVNYAAAVRMLEAKRNK